MTLVFIAAEAREFDGILKHAGDVQKLTLPVQFARRAQMNGRTIVMLANGPGPKLAAEAAQQAAKAVEKIDAFVSTGYCGALDKNLPTFSIVVASSVNGSPAREPSANKNAASGPLVSQDSVACTVDEKTRLNKSGAIAVEMEAAGVEQVANGLGVPFYCVRVVTDAAQDALALDFNKVRDREGRFSRTRILAAALRRPAQLIPELMKLQRTSKRASIALGDFIADCRF